MVLVSCKDIEYESGSTSILRGVSFDVKKGEVVTIVGPSGSGKSTLLRLLADLVSPTKGNIYYKDQPISVYEPTDYRSKVRYIPQTPKLFAGTVRSNFEFVCKIHKTSFSVEESEKLLELLEMPSSYLDKNVTKLSGGEKQRIALVRSLLFMPEVLLLDEPTSALDRKNTQIVETALMNLRKLGTTMLWITHNEEQSSRVATKIMTLESGKVSTIVLNKEKT